MSEYRYYEFQALERRLTEAEMAEIQTLSSRVVLTSTSAAFTYSFGDFPRDPKRVLEKYFDAMLYTADWGTRRLVFRFPKGLVKPMAVQALHLNRCLFTLEAYERIIDAGLSMPGTKRGGEPL